MSLSTIERVLFLRQAELFSQIPSQELSDVAQLCQEVHFDGGEQFITQGDMGDCLYVVVEGQAEITIDGVGAVLYRVSKDIIGEMAIISRKPRSANCVATTPITALQINHDDFWDLMGEKPVLAQAVIRVLADRLDEAAKNLSRLQKNDRD